MCSLNRLDVEIQRLFSWVLPNRGIAGVGQRTCLAIAKTSHIVFVTAKRLLLFSSGFWLARCSHRFPPAIFSLRIHLFATFGK